MPMYKRILLKLSGEALMGDDAYGINRRRSRASCARCVVTSRLRGCHGDRRGNIFRGVAGARSAWTARPPTTWACSRR